VEGVDFEYTAGTTLRSTSSWVRAWRRVTALAVASFRILNHRKTCDSVVLYGESYIHLLWLRWVCTCVGMNLIACVVEWPLAEEDELPEWAVQNKIRHYSPIISPTGYGQWNSRRFYRRVFLLADGLVVTSRFLEDRCRESGNEHCMRIPVLVDPEVWETVEAAVRERPYLLFCAYLDGYVHDALFLIKALETLGQKGIDLLMVGRASADTCERIEEAAREAGRFEQLHLYTDYVEDKTLTSLYAGAIALLAPLHHDARSLARFPSKIGHYLMSGRPVVTFAVGDVCEHLEDGVSAFLYETDDHSALAGKLQEILIRKDADKVGLLGRSVATQSFDYRAHGRKMDRFLLGIRHNGQVAGRNP